MNVSPSSWKSVSVPFVLLNEMCSSVLERSIFLCLKAVSHSWSDADEVAFCGISSSWWPIRQKSTIERLWNIWQQLFSSSASQRVLKRRCLCGGLARTKSSYPGLLHRNSDRHFIIEVEASVSCCKVWKTWCKKGCGCLNSFQREFSELWGNSNVIDFWFVTLLKLMFFHKVFTTNKREKHWDNLWKWLFLQSSRQKVRCAGIPP